MTLDPLETGLCPCQMPLIDSIDDWLDDVPVLHALASGVLPVVGPPFLKPLCHTFDGVVRVAVYHGILINRHDV